MMFMPKFPDWIFINDETLQRFEIDNLVKSEMEIGPQKTRPKQSVPLFNTTIDISFTEDKYNDWITWKRDDLQFGASWFLMKDPFNGEKIKARIINNDSALQKKGNLIFTQLIIESYNVLYE